MKNIPRILVVDDEPGICQNVQKILAKNDYEVFQASSAGEALKELGKKSYSLLISDIVMPEMNGLELLKEVKGQWPLIQVLMMTAYASTDTAVKAIRLGALDYIPKPFTPDELRSAIARSLSGELREAPVPDDEKTEIDAVHLGVSIDKMSEAQTAGAYCPLGDRVCEIFQKKNKTCKAGEKKGICPKKAKEDRAAAKMYNGASLVGVDTPFNYEEIINITGPQYISNLDRDGFSYLPYEELKKSAARVQAKLEQARAPRIEKAFVSDILVIDDETAVNNNIRKILKKSGYSVDQATTKDEALKKIDKGYYRMIVLDLKIPGVVGLELLESVKKMQPEARVIIITGYASIETAVETSRMGAMQYLPKPFTPAEMRDTVERASRLAA